LTSRYFSIFLAVSSSILTVRFFVILGQPTHSSVHTHSIKPSCVVCSQKSTRPPSCTHTLHVRVRACARGCKWVYRWVKTWWRESVIGLADVVIKSASGR
jgi:hypothetical protein